MLISIKKYYDSFYCWAAPVLSALVILASAFLTYDFSSLRETYPNWDRQFEILQNSIPFVLFISAGLSLVFSLLYLPCRPTIKNLLKDLDDIKSKNELVGENIKNVFDGYLYQLSKKLDFGSNQSNCERVTIYIHDRISHFIPFGRFSANPAYRGPGRTQYPDSQGCIAKGWQNGWHFENRLGENRTYEKNNREKYDINKEILDTIKMKSKLYAVKRIDGENGDQLAVIVVESLTAGRFDEQDLKMKVEQEEGYIAELIAKLKDHIPSLGNARQRGF